MDAVAYLHLSPGAAPPPWTGPAPFKAVLVLDTPADAVWRTAIAAWLARSGCRYALAWGIDCEAWHDAIDDDAIAAFPGEPRDDDLIMTTWHDDEPLEEVAHFTAHAAQHPSLDLPATLVVHVAAAPDEARMRAVFAPG